MSTLSHLSQCSGRTPVVIDMPHAGSHYPCDFDYACNFMTLRRSEDTHCDLLWNFAPSMGAAVVSASVARTYINLNARVADVTRLLRDDAGPSVGDDDPEVSLVAQHLADGSPIYARELSLAEIRHRIEEYWLPYHRTLASMIAAAHSRHGHVIHLNCYSKPSLLHPCAEHDHSIDPDILLCDREGLSADTRITRSVERFLRERGLTVAVNRPFKDSELIKRHGNPSQGRHSLQIMVNKRLYMDEDTLDLRHGFLTTRRVLMDLAEWIVTRDVAANPGDVANGGH